MLWAYVSRHQPEEEPEAPASAFPLPWTAVLVVALDAPLLLLDDDEEADAEEGGGTGGRREPPPPPPPTKTGPGASSPRCLKCLFPPPCLPCLPRPTSSLTAARIGTELPLPLSLLLEADCE